VPQSFFPLNVPEQDNCLQGIIAMQSMGYHQGQGQNPWCQAMYGGNLVSVEVQLKATPWLFDTHVKRVSIHEIGQ
jgi:hypothetical protein